MTPSDLSRRHLEALLVARALAYREAEWILARVDQGRVSRTALQLLEQLRPGADVATERSNAQHSLAERVRAITVYELLLISRDDLLALVNALPARPMRQRAWERDLVAGLVEESVA